MTLDEMLEEWAEKIALAGQEWANKVLRREEGY